MEYLIFNHIWSACARSRIPLWTLLWLPQKAGSKIHNGVLLLAPAEQVSNTDLEEVGGNELARVTLANFFSWVLSVKRVYFLYCTGWVKILVSIKMTSFRTFWIDLFQFFAGFFWHVYLEKNKWCTKFLGWKLTDIFQLYLRSYWSDDPFFFENLWMQDCMAQQPLVANLDISFIFRQEIKFEDLTTSADNIKDHDFRLC